uniref:SCP domain-containing protein n=1 Tax=Mesocestoides corti TaxID=53468 RepID=A0A5K3F181_MESCO
MMLAQSREVGCAVLECPTSGHVVGCLYDPGVKVPDIRPYEVGTSCTNCPKDFECYRKQCKEKSTPDRANSLLELSQPTQSALTKAASSSSASPMIATLKILACVLLPALSLV